MNVYKFSFGAFADSFLIAPDFAAAISLSETEGVFSSEAQADIIGVTDIGKASGAVDAGGDYEIYE